MLIVNADDVCLGAHHFIFRGALEVWVGQSYFFYSSAGELLRLFFVIEGRKKIDILMYFLQLN